MRAVAENSANSVEAIEAHSDLDVDDDGHLSKHEFLRVSATSASMAYCSIHVLGCSALSVSPLRLIVCFRQGNDESSASVAFACLDIDGNVKVSVAEAIAARRKFDESTLSKLSPSELHLWLTTDACVPAHLSAEQAHVVILSSTRGSSLWSALLQRDGTEPALQSIGAKAPPASPQGTACVASSVPQPAAVTVAAVAGTAAQHDSLTHAVCREIEGFGCFSKMPRETAPLDWLRHLGSRGAEFAGSDGNGDGRLSRQEFSEARGSRATFACLDQVKHAAGPNAHCRLYSLGAAGCAHARSGTCAMDCRTVSLDCIGAAHTGR